MRLIPYHGYDEISQQLEIVLFDNKVNPSRCLLIVNDWSSCELSIFSQPSASCWMEILILVVCCVMTPLHRVVYM